MNYEQFIESKKHSGINHGIEPIDLPDIMFDYQKHVAEYAIRKGRCAVFLDTGLGKTIIELTVADNYNRETGKPVLIITPLAVAFQFVEEAKKFGISDVEYSKQGEIKSRIVVCNYERLNKFSPDDFDCVILDESSILKNFNGAIKHEVTTFLKQVKYRYLFTATPSPNDYIELGTSAEALGELGYMDMLGRFFANNENNIRPQDIGTKFYLKPHAKDHFFNWVRSWSISMRKPSDLGYSDERHELPELIVNYHKVYNQKNWVIDGQKLMFNIVAKRMSEVREEQKMTITERSEKAAGLAQGWAHTVYWCNFNDEGDLLEQLDPDAVQVKGGMSLDKKEDILLNFSKGEIKNLITKAKMTAFGLNWQHCNHTVYFPTFSFEQYYQAVRRFWRFGQCNPVTVDMVYSDGQKRVIQALEDKIERAGDLFTMLSEATNKYKFKDTSFDKQLTLPKFL